MGRESALQNRSIYKRRVGCKAIDKQQSNRSAQSFLWALLLDVLLLPLLPTHLHPTMNRAAQRQKVLLEHLRGSQGGQHADFEVRHLAAWAPLITPPHLPRCPAAARLDTADTPPQP